MSGPVLPVDDAEAVLAHLEESGAFDELRQQLIRQVEANEALRKRTFDMILESKHLPQLTKDKRAMGAACEAIRKELTGKLLEGMVETLWAEMNHEEGQLHKNMQAEAHRALCKVYEQRAHASQGTGSHPQPPG